MLRRYIEIVEDVHVGARIPIDGNPNTVEQRLCNVCGKTIGDSSAEVWAALTVIEFYDGGRRSLSADICPEDKGKMTLAELQRGIVEGTISR